MRLPLVRRGLGHHRRVHAAVVLGVATATAVLGGALLVGESVRGSLRDIALARLGGVAYAVRAGTFFRETLGADLGARLGVRAAPVIAVSGVAVLEASGRRASGIQVLGVDDRFWTVHGRPVTAPRGREALVSPALAAEISPPAGGTLLVTVQRPLAIPASSLFGRRDDLSRALRVSVTGVLAAADGGEFSLEASQQSARTVFVPLALLQRTIEQPGRADTVLLGPGNAGVADAVRATATLEDVGVRVRPVADGTAVAIESDTGLVTDALAAEARAVAPGRGVLVYLANAMRVGDREVPYSVIAGMDDAALAEWGVSVTPDGPVPIVLNDWTARRLRATVGSPLRVEYYLWREEGRLETATAAFTVAAVVPMAGIAADPDLVPSYPGITTALHLADWDPPFPLDLSRVTPADEEYWAAHRATPKAFIPLAAAQRLWGHRLGQLTSIRVPGGDPATVAEALRRRLDPLALGFVVDPARERALASAKGSTDFAEYFTYFSAFLVASALLLAALFFRLGLEQRAAEIGLMRAVGFGPGRVRRLFLAEALVLSAAGAVLGTLGAAGWAAALLAALRTWWVGAVGTRAIALHLAPGPLALGAAITIVCAVASAAWTLRDLGKASPRALIAGALGDSRDTPSRRWWIAAVLGAGGLLLVAASAARQVALVPGFFGGAMLLLGASLAAARAWLAGAGGVETVRSGVAGIAWLGLRGARHRPGRSTLCIALIAFATFLVVAVGAFRRDAGDDEGRDSGSGGFSLIAQSLIPIHHDLASPKGRAELNLGGRWPVRRVARFHVRDGDDASCLNLYAPRNPRIVAPEARFIADGGFRFGRTLASSDAEKANPWLLLQHSESSGAIPVIADASSLEYVLHRKVGDEIVLDRPGAQPIRLLIVGALEDSVFQSELVMGEFAFRRLFPEDAGYRMFLLDAAGPDEAAVVTRLESALADQGLDVSAMRDRLAAYHRVENTYLSTFQALGGLGLVLGTVGLGTVLLRNALERRREIALLRALGYRPRQVSGMLLAENAALLAAGVAAGLACALVAVVPAVMQRGGALPLGAIAVVAGAVVVTGLITSALAGALVRRSPLLAALRSE
jgi:putative ABC transport system permease protein